MSEHPFDDQLAGYALDALERDEAAFLERHLAECARCRDEVRRWRETTAALATQVPLVTPPPSLRARVLATATGTAAPAGVPAADDRPAAPSAVPPVAPARAPARAVAPDAGRPAASRGAWLTAAACAVLVVGLGGAWAQERVERRALADAVRQSQAALATRTRELADRDSLLASALAPDVEVATLAATGATPSVRLFRDRSRRVLVLSARRLPPAATGRTYQLWGIGADGRPVGLGLFNTAPDGSVVVRLPVTTDRRFAVSAVTDEPAGGSPQPTSTPFLVGSWADATD